MSNKNIQEVEGVAVSSLSDTDAFEIDTGSASVYILWSSIKSIIASLTATWTNKTLTSPVLTTPTIADFTNANHTHAGASSGGAITASVLVQAAHTQSGAVQTGTTTIPYDDTIPQNTEGTEFFTQAITPTSATNKLLIECVLNVAGSVVAVHIAALFQDSTANALAAVSSEGVTTANRTRQLIFQYEMVSGTISSTTFKIRAGLHSAGTITINGDSGSRKFGGVMISSLRITEIKV